MEGLVNLGATCAINSLIQMLFRLNRFKEIILNSDEKEGTLTFELKNLFECMGNNQTVSPNRFINNFYILFKGIFNKFEQNDICELYLFVIQKIHDEMCYDNNNINKSYCNIFEEHNYKIACHNNFKTSKIYDLLQGSYMNTIECIGCGNINKNFEPFIYIGLDIEDNSSISELLLKHFTSETRSKDNWKCDKCNNNCNYNKTSIIWKCPDILFISLNRFKEIIKKNLEIVNINKQLIYNRTYNLHGIGYHHGMLEGGHYNAICKNSTNFYYYDDNNVGIITDLEPLLKSNNSYLICYES
jgi:ubiquitin C-terminal hydrolase